MSRHTPAVEPVAVTIPDACRMTGLGKTKLFELLTRGEMRSFTEGRRRLVSVASIHEWRARREKEAGFSVPAPEAA